MCRVAGVFLYVSCSGGIFYVSCSRVIFYESCSGGILMCHVAGVF